LKIRQATFLDCDSLVKLHFDSQVEGVLKELSSGLLADFYYKPMLLEKENQIWVAHLEDGTIVGVISVTNLPNRNKSVGLRIGLRVGIELLIASVRKPSIIMRSINFLLAHLFINSFISTRNESGFELQLLLVSGEYQNSGIGSALIRAVNTIVGDSTYCIVQTQNEEATKFYKRFGFEAVKRFHILGASLWIFKREGTHVE